MALADPQCDGPAQTFVAGGRAVRKRVAGDAEADGVTDAKRSRIGFHRNLGAAGVGEVLIAGRSRELGGLAVDGELYDGIDVVAALSALLERLGAPAEGDLA